MDDKTKGQEKYLQGLELAKKGLTPDEIAKELGLFNARAWSTMKAYHGRKGLAELAAPKTANDPEPAAILEGVDCQRSEPRPLPMRNAECGTQGAEAPMRNAECGVLNGSFLPAVKGERLEELKVSHAHKQPEKPEEMRYWPVTPESKPRMAVRRMLAADGELVRYRVEGDLLQINSKGQKRAALEIDLSDARRMMDELNDFLEQVGV